MDRKHVKRHDPLSPRQRSAQMAKVRAKANRSTDMRVAATLIRRGFRGWKRHCQDIPGCPDFYFVTARLAVFVDGCFWHGCPVCNRNLPHSRRRFWREKIKLNRRRDRKVKSILQSLGYRVIRIWEHALGNYRWLMRLESILQKSA